MNALLHFKTALLYTRLKATRHRPKIQAEDQDKGLTYWIY